jgi:excinuclease ABC subunit C
MRQGARVAVGRLPGSPGVYRFRDESGRILYIGRATNLRHRVDSYWGKLSDRRHLTRMVPRIAVVEAVACDSVHEAAWLERNLLERRKPYWNRARGGQEVPVYIRLDQQVRSAGLRMVHEHELLSPARHFGPYLGGVKVRMAISALHRVLPVAYAADNLTGSERDMARARGIAPADRDALVRTAVAVLDRHPDALIALVAELARRRDAAAAELSFELAARMQQEIEAVEWVAAEQKASTLEPHHTDVHGFAGGILVRFEVRAGRLGGWTQRACTEAAARDAVAATPPAWQPFAQRNAELAALLAS